MTITSASTSTELARPDLVPVTIDGIRTEVAKGTLVIRAAEQLGIAIPRFCDHPLLDPVGACRQCLVEIPDMGNGRGMPKPQASCTLTVMPNMVVQTQLTSPVADKAQHGVMELLLLNHPLDCPICDKGGECPLQNQALSNGGAETRFTQGPKRTYTKPIAISSNVLLDRERCVLCARCTRFSQQIAGDPFIELLERGALQQVGIYADEPFESYFSGNTVQICPVGALTGASYRFRSRPYDLVSTPSVCEQCAAGCAQRTDVRVQTVQRRLAGLDPEVNEEWNCDKGRWAFTYATQPDRLTHPLVRDDITGELVAASWPEALDIAARGLAAARGRGQDGAGGAAVLLGGRHTVEDAYAYAKFARVALATNDIDSRARPGGDEELAFLASSVAGRYLETTYDDLEKAPAVVLAGFEPEEESPIVFLRLRKAARRHGTRIFTLAPFRSPGAVKTGATLLQTVPGEEARVLGALVSSDDDAAMALRRPGAVLLVGERLAAVPGALSAAARLATASGARLAWVPRRAGERGAVDAGALPTLLPGGRLVTDPVARAEVEAVWGTVPAAAGRDLTAILQAARAGELDALVVGGVDPADCPDPELALDALDAVGFLVSLELRRSPVTDRADVVLPVAAAVEKSGTYLDWEGRARPFDLVLRTTGALPDGRVLHTLADELDTPIHLPDTASARAEIARIGVAATHPPTPSYDGWARVQPQAGEAVLSTWHWLLDDGSLQDGEPHLAGTAKQVRLHLSAATAAEVGVVQGQLVQVSTERGSVELPLVVADLPDRVVWLPTRSPDAAVRRDLAAVSGDLVRLRPGGAA